VLRSQNGIQLYVDLHIIVDGELSVRAGHLLSHKVEGEILGALEHVAEVLVHVETQEELTTKANRKHSLPLGKGSDVTFSDTL
jgi:divalent metal cation (Fe/Co/Zn/Cd) transporter